MPDAPCTTLGAASFQPMLRASPRLAGWKGAAREEILSQVSSTSVPGTDHVLASRPEGGAPLPSYRAGQRDKWEGLGVGAG